LRQELASAIALLEEAVTDRFPFRSSGNALNFCHCPNDGDAREHTLRHRGTPKSGAWPYGPSVASMIRSV